MTSTIRGVHLMRVGTWNASTGQATITADDLTAMVEASRSRLIDRPPLKIGHDDDNPVNATLLGDGAPALGWVENLRTSEDGQTLLGDLVGVPAKLADVMPDAFRRRSVELIKNFVDPDGHKHPAVLTGLALLGVPAPAVKGLDDILALYAEREQAAQNLTVLLADGDPRTPSGETKEGEADMATQNDLTPLLEGLTPEQLDQIVELAKKLQAADGDTLPAADIKAADAPQQPSTTKQVAASEPPAPEVITLSQATYDALLKGAQAGQAAFAQLQQRQVDDAISMALSDGRILPAEEATWRQAIKDNHEGTLTLLSSLTPKYPTAPLGSPIDASRDQVDEDAFAAFSAGMFGDTVKEA